jgi:hypothetical protein
MRSLLQRSALISVLVVVLVGAGTAHASRLWWDAPFAIEGGAPPGGLDAVSCTSSFCMAVGGDTFAMSTLALREPRMQWLADRVRVPDPPTDLIDVDCPSEKLCLVADGGGRVFASGQPSYGNEWREVAKFPTIPVALDCASERLCLIVGSLGRAIVSADPTAGPSAWRTWQLDTEDCPQACRSQGSDFGSPLIQAVTCPAESMCLAGDLLANILSSTQPAGALTPWPVAWKDPKQTSCAGSGCPAPIQDVSCASVDLCVAVDFAGAAAVSAAPLDGVPWRLTNLHLHPPDLTEVTCVPMRCIIAGGGQRLYESSDPARGEWNQASFRPDRIWQGLSCASAQLCMAVGTHVTLGHAGPSVRTVRAQLRELVQSPARLRRRGMRFAFEAPVAGAVAMDLRRTDGRRVASASLAYPVAGEGAVRLRLTKAGRRLLARGRRPRLVTRVTLTPTAAEPISVVRTRRW